MKLNKDQYVLSLISWHIRIHNEIERIDRELEKYKGIKRSYHYHYIGSERPSTGRVTPETNPELFQLVAGYPLILDGLLELASELETHIHIIGGHDKHEQSTEVQHTPQHV